ncbi:protein of unknown function [Legionella fallonii LLAP-10]|uniref:Uncharacterized protein n=1 Tax=Legionella fallonii LLAP-10 TaxID=1212491 RepID=A0A098FZA7_9GAMM|nr:protein of unknown function [Legionella fallonii LLAP-10]
MFHILSPSKKQFNLQLLLFYFLQKLTYKLCWLLLNNPGGKGHPELSGISRSY